MQIPIFKPPHVLFGFSSSSDRKTSINQWQSTCNGTVPESLGLLVCTSPRWSLIAEKGMLRDPFDIEIRIV